MSSKNKHEFYKMRVQRLHTGGGNVQWHNSHSIFVLLKGKQDVKTNNIVNCVAKYVKWILFLAW